MRPVVAVSSCTAAGLPSSSTAQRIIALSPALQLNQGWPRVNHSCSYYRVKRERDTEGVEEWVWVCVCVPSYNIHARIHAGQQAVKMKQQMQR